MKSPTGPNRFRGVAPLGAIVLFLAAVPSTASLLFHDEFDYATGDLTNQAAWSDISGSADGSIDVTSGNLGATLPDASPYPEVGNRVVAGSGAEDLRTVSFGSQFDTTTYFSLLLRVDSTPGLGSSPTYMFGLRDGNNQLARYFLVAEGNGPEFRMGVNGSNLGDAPGATTGVLDFGTVYRIVGKFDATTDPDTITLWVDPTGFTEATAGAPAAQVTNSVSQDDPSHFFLRQGNDWDNGSSSWTIDSLRVGTTFEDVALAPAPVPFLSGAGRGLLVGSLALAAGLAGAVAAARARPRATAARSVDR